MPALELHKVIKIFNPHQWNEVNAVKEVSLSFDWGESVLIVGENGSGKTTLMNLVDGTVELSGGQVILAGVDVSTWPAHRRHRSIHRIHQDPSHGMAPLGTITENLEIFNNENTNLLNFRNIPKGGSFNFAKVIAEINPDLATKLEHKIFRLSPGQRQAVALAMLALRNGTPRILLADEPTAALDPHSAGVCLALMNEKAAKGWLVLHVTHNSSIIDVHRGRTIVMDDGKVISDAC